MYTGKVVGGVRCVEETDSDLGRHADALAMFERVLEFQRRVLPWRCPLTYAC